MKFKLATLAALLAASPAFADTTNGPDPYAPGYGFDTPTEASWGGWNRGDADTTYAEWDTFIDSSYPGTRTAAPDLGNTNASNANISWNSGTFPAGSGNLYSFSVAEIFQLSLDSSITGPVRVVLQTETWGNTIDSMLLNGLAPSFSQTMFNGLTMTDAVGEVDLKQILYYWDLAAAPTSYVFDFTTPVHTTVAQIAVDIAAAPVPEPETYAMLAAGLGLVGWQVRRRNKSAQTTA